VPVPAPQRHAYTAETIRLAAPEVALVEADETWIAAATRQRPEAQP
jgi:hypothetical protein